VHTWSAPLGADRRVQVAVTDRADGDLCVDSPPDQLEQRRRSVIDRPWIWLRQVHGADVAVLGPHDLPSEIAGGRADAVVTSRRDVAIAAHSADCATVALWSGQGLIAVVHAGWRGLGAGVISNTAASMRSLGATDLQAFVGPSIGPECYAFGAIDLEQVVKSLGTSVVGRTATGDPALDVRAGVRIELQRNDIELRGGVEDCTSCHPDRYWSYRARGDAGRQALVCWVES